MPWLIIRVIWEAPLEPDGPDRMRDVVGSERMPSRIDLAVGLREARVIDGATQQQAADRCGISQPRWSGLERGLGAGASIETWAVAAAAMGMQLAAFLEGAPGAERPRDIEHALRQSRLIEFAASGGWRGLPELAVDLAVRSRSVDVALTRQVRREAAVMEIWDGSMTSARRSAGSTRRSSCSSIASTAWLRTYVGAWPPVSSSATRPENRRLMNELRPLFVARFRASSQAWLSALRDPKAPMPMDDGFLWSDRSGRVTGSHLRRR